MKLMVLDGNSILNRSYYGIRPLTTKDGFYTQAIYGFLVTMARLEDEERPDAVCVAFDRREPTFRHLEYEGYKAQLLGHPLALGLVAIWSTRATRPSARGCPRSWRCSFR